MWPFRHESCTKRLLAAEERIETLERQLRGVQLEWAETYDKLARLYGRLVKRDQLDGKENPKPSVGASSDNGEGTTSAIEKGRILASIRGQRGLLPR